MPALRTVVRVGIVVFVGLVAAEHALRPDLSPGQRFISEYARGWTRPVQQIAFVAWAVASMGCAALAARVPGRRAVRTVTAAGFATAAAGTALAAAFTTQTVAGELPAGVKRTVAGQLHDLGTLLTLGGLVVAALASLGLLRATRYRITVGALGLALVSIVPTLVVLRLDAPGVGQRAFVLVGCAFGWSFAAQAAAARLP